MEEVARTLKELECLVKKKSKHIVITDPALAKRLWRAKRFGNKLVASGITLITIRILFSLYCPMGGLSCFGAVVNFSREV